MPTVMDLWGKLDLDRSFICTVEIEEELVFSSM